MSEKNPERVKRGKEAREKMLGAEMELPIIMQFRVGPEELATIVNKLKEEKDFGPLRSMSALGRFLIEFTAANIVDKDEEIVKDYDEGMEILYDMGFVKDYLPKRSVQRDIRNRRRVEWKEIRKEKLEMEEREETIEIVKKNPEEMNEEELIVFLKGAEGREWKEKQNKLKQSHSLIINPNENNGEVQLAHIGREEKTSEQDKEWNVEYKLRNELAKTDLANAKKKGDSKEIRKYEKLVDDLQKELFVKYPELRVETL